MSQILEKKTNTILQIEKLNINYSKSRRFFGRSDSYINAVRDFSIEIHEDEILSLVGESGCGKTSVARSILKLIVPSSGSIIFGESTIRNLSGKKYREYLGKVQIIFQDPFESLNPRLEVREIVSLPIRYLLGVKDPNIVLDKVRKVLQEVGLNPEELLNRYPHQLSGGQRQRVNIARALASDPKLLIADEPITMLDAAQRINILRLLTKLRRDRGLAILMITHDLASAKMISDRIVVMYLGKVVEQGSADDVLLQPHHPYVELIRSSMPSITAPKVEISERSVTMEESRKISMGCVFRPRCPYATDICKNQEPPLEEKSSSHYAACHNPLNLNGNVIST